MRARTKQKTETIAVGGFITKAETARCCQITIRTLERWMQEGKVPFMKVGRGRRATVRFSWPDVEANLKARFGQGGALN